jgi:hypothetical protein
LSKNENPSFSIAVFDVTAEMMVRSAFDTSQLSPNWLQLCGSLLAAHGTAFAVDLTGPLAHLSLRFTAATGAAMVTLSARGHLATSILVLTGRAAEAEAELLELFQRSVASAAEKQVGRPADGLAFGGLRSLTERPLALIVAWGNPETAEEEDLGNK